MYNNLCALARLKILATNCIYKSYYDMYKDDLAL